MLGQVTTKEICHCS